MVSRAQMKPDAEENKKAVKTEKEQPKDNESHYYLDENQKFLDGRYVAKKLDVSLRTLLTLAESGEFVLGRIGSRVIVRKDSLLEYLDRYHFMGAESPDDEIVYDSKGRIKPGLTRVKEKHTDIPQLKGIAEFAKRLVPPLNTRSFLRHCDIGTFRHYRIGTNYKMSEEDWEKSLEKITEQYMKLEDDAREKRKVGRPSNIAEKVPRDDDEED